MFDGSTTKEEKTCHYQCQEAAHGLCALFAGPPEQLSGQCMKQDVVGIGSLA